MRYTNTMRKESLQRLRKLINPGDTLYVIQRHIAPSSMSRVLSIVCVRNQRCVDITLSAAILLNKPVQERAGKSGLKITGMDANFAASTVAKLSDLLYSEVAPTGKNADPDSPNPQDRPADMWLTAEWL
jgi:hypothetical protein